jgi:acyl-coenzyme A synthetase/AMP-(fatty) acid ligase
LANNKVSRHVVVVEELPRNSSMKTIKPELRKRWTAIRHLDN